MISEMDTTTTNVPFEDSFPPKRSYRSASAVSNSNNISLNNNEEKTEREEVRTVLVKHWTSLDRARLHTFHLWLFIYAVAQIFLSHYLCHRFQLENIPYFVFCLIFLIVALLSFILIRYSDENSPFALPLVGFSILSSLTFPVFIWLIHLPLISEKRSERIADLSSLYSSLALTTFYQCFVLPRHRRLFLIITICFNLFNILLITLVLYGHKEEQLEKSGYSHMFSVSERRPVVSGFHI